MRVSDNFNIRYSLKVRSFLLFNRLIFFKVWIEVTNNFKRLIIGGE